MGGPPWPPLSRGKLLKSFLEVWRGGHGGPPVH
jgi:hypothetical protein